MARTRDVIMLLGILLGIGDIKVASDVLDAERRVSLRQIRVREGACEAHLVKFRVEHIDRAKTEIGRVDARARGIDSQPFVDRTRAYLRVIDRENGIVQVYIGVPAGYRAIFGGKDEEARARFTVFGNNKATAAIEDNAGRGCRCTGGTTRGRRDGDHQRDGLTVAIIKCGYACAIVRNPPGSARNMYQAP